MRPVGPVADFNRKVAGIFRHYRQSHDYVTEKTGGCYKLTELGAWATSRPAHIFYFFKRLDLSRYALFADLGSGDGLVACIAGLFTLSVGVEIDLGLCARAGRSSAELGLDGRVKYVCADYLTQRIRRADCLYLYPDKPLDALEGILAEWGGSLLVYGPHIPPRWLTGVETLHCGRERMVRYEKSIST